MKFITISSTLNPHIREVIRMRQKKSLAKERTFLIEGPHLLEAAIEAGKSIQKAFFTEHFHSRKDGQRLLQQVAGETGDIYEVPEHLLKKISDTETPQGIIAVVSSRLPDLRDLAPAAGSLYVVIDGIQDPGNLGTIIRTADAAGADAAILLPGTCDVFMPKAVRSTAGSIFNIPLVRAETETFLKWIEEKRIALTITEQNGETSLFDAVFSFPLSLVFGNEAHGVSGSVRKAASYSLRIPILGKAESLNVSVSAAVCLYEAARQRGLDHRPS